MGASIDDTDPSYFGVSPLLGFRAIAFQGKNSVPQL